MTIPIRAVSEVITAKRPESTEEIRAWHAWVATLKTGDVVLVCDYYSQRAIYEIAVRVTPTGRVHADRDRKDWSKHPRTHIVGGGDRFLAPKKETT